MAETLDVRYAQDNIARIVANRWSTWDGLRSNWLEEKKELRRYLFATSTRDTSNSKLPWKNSTVTPKLTQIRDNLHANYLAALFPREEWFKWKAGDSAATSKKKRDAITAYMRTKLLDNGFEETISQLVLDYIDYGNVFAGYEYVDIRKKDPITGTEASIYKGPKIFRISPTDIVFDPMAPSFAKSPCIVRRIKTLGDLENDVLTKPALEYQQDVLAKLKEMRTSGALINQSAADGISIDGFGSISAYYESGMVELLDFYGDIYDQSTGEFHKDMIITIADRRWILRMSENKHWSGSRPIVHCGWRLRPDNVWAQGPLDQLVGLQYRIDHLENLKADVFDQIAHPITLITGETVDDFEFGPGIKINMGSEGKVEFARPDAAALSADTEIQILMDRMEELAGAPKQAAGIRTPGEKTKYEVQVLENGAGRIFQSKVNWFEVNVIEPILDGMLAEALRNIGPKESVKMVDPDLGTESFVDVTKDDITAKGRFSAQGARHFSEQAIFVQELTQTLQLIQQIPSVAAHISGKNIARALEEVMGWKTFAIVKDNALVTEQADTQRIMQAADERIKTEAAIPSELQDADYVAPEGTVEQPDNEASTQGLDAGGMAQALG